MRLMAITIFDYFKDRLSSLENNYLEIGIWHGTSVSELAKLFPNKTIYAIDPFIEDGFTSHESSIQQGDQLSDNRNIVLENIKGLTNLHLYEMTSKDFFDSLTQDTISQMNVSHVMIDGSHHYDDVILDTQLAMTVIGNKAGTVAFDDTNLEGVEKAMNEFHSNTLDRIESFEDMHPNTRIYKIKSL